MIRLFILVDDEFTIERRINMGHYFFPEIINQMSMLLCFQCIGFSISLMGRISARGIIFFARILTCVVQCLRRDGTSAVE